MTQEAGSSFSCRNVAGLETKKIHWNVASLFRFHQKTAPEVSPLESDIEDEQGDEDMPSEDRELPFPFVANLQDLYAAKKSQQKPVERENGTIWIGLL